MKLEREFLHSTGLPEDSFGVDVEMKMARLDRAEGTGFFRGFTLRSLAVRQARIDASLGKGPLVSAVGIDQQELHRRALPAVADCGDL